VALGEWSSTFARIVLLSCPGVKQSKNTALFTPLDLGVLFPVKNRRRFETLNPHLLPRPYLATALNSGDVAAK
jgi:hypothetical protein